MTSNVYILRFDNVSDQSNFAASFAANNILKTASIAKL